MQGLHYSVQHQLPHTTVGKQHIDMPSVLGESLNPALQSIESGQFFSVEPMIHAVVL